VQLDDAPTFLMLLDMSYLSEYGILRTNKRVWLPAHKSLACYGLADFLVRIGMDEWVDG